MLQRERERERERERKFILNYKMRVKVQLNCILWREEWYLFTFS